MKFVTDALLDKMMHGAATPDEKIIYSLLSAVGDVSPAEAAQLIRQAEAICEMRDQCRFDLADALLDLFASGSLEVARGPQGIEFKLTESGMDHATSLVARLTGRVN